MALTSLTPLFRSHSRSFDDNRFVYPVVSRRSGGVSIGVNLNPDKYCNFDCVYCQVDRTLPGARVLRKLDLPQLRTELDDMVALATGGGLFEGTRFSATPPEYRCLKDIALSGDGEPTVSPVFGEVVQICADVRAARCLNDVKLVLITNATMLQHPRVLQALEIFDANNGEIWGKLDAGTEDYYQQVDRTKVTLTEVMENLTVTARKRPIVIQSLFMRLDGAGPPPAEQAAYCNRLNEIVAAGGQIKLVQIHTIARKPAESIATPLENAEVDALVGFVRRQTGLRVEPYYGSA